MVTTRLYPQRKLCHLEDTTKGIDKKLPIPESL